MEPTREGPKCGRPGHWCGGLRKMPDDGFLAMAHLGMTQVELGKRYVPFWVRFPLSIRRLGERLLYR